MIVRRIALTGFRNYDFETAEFDAGTNVICGRNAQGKTNLLEAVYMLAMGRSFRTRFDKELVGRILGKSGAKFKCGVVVVGHAGNICNVDEVVAVQHSQPIGSCRKNLICCNRSRSTAGIDNDEVNAGHFLGILCENTGGQVSIATGAGRDVSIQQMQLRREPKLQRGAVREREREFFS